MLAAYIDHNLSPDERSKIESHLIECRNCRRTIILVLKSKSVVSDPTPQDPFK